MKYLAGGLLLFLVVFAAACMPDKCRDTRCNNDGICVFGACTCLNGYEGPFCDTVWRDRYLGDWQVKAWYGDDTGATHYTISVFANERPDQFVVSQLAHGTDSLRFLRATAYSFSMAEQSVDSLISVHSGTGFIQPGTDSVNVSYTLQVGDSTARYNMIWTR